MEKIYDLIIIGGGPSGITAGIYAARKKMKTLLLTKDFIGQAGETSQIDNYPGLPNVSGWDLMEKFKNHLKMFEIEIMEGKEVGEIKKENNKFLVGTTAGDKFLAKSIIAATGRNPRPLGVPGEKEFIGKGVSYCSICDAPFFKDKAVAIIGGGNSGFEAALDLAKFAKKIFIFERGNEVKADEILQDEVAKEKKIEIHLNKEIKKIEGNGKVQDLVYQDNKTGKTYQVPMDGVFVQIGSVPATGYLKGLVDFNQYNEVTVKLETCETSTPGVFAAGDINSGKWKQVIIAAGEGARAALAAYDYTRLDKINKKQ